MNELASSSLAISRTTSHRTGDGHFRNPWPSAQLHGVGDFLKWTLLERVAQETPAQPNPASFRRATPNVMYPRTPVGTLAITWVGHTTFLVQQDGVNILLDPVWSERASPLSCIGPKRWVEPGLAFDALPPVDFVVLSHDHYDHLDRHTVKQLVHAHPTARWVAPLGVGAWLQQRGARVHAELDWWNSATVQSTVQSATFPEIRVTCTPAQHFSGRSPFNRNNTLWCGWTLRTAAHNVFFAGDTAYHPEFADIAQQLGPFDAAILPIGAYEPRWFMGAVHMDAMQAVDAYQDLTRDAPHHPCLFVASHWGTFKLTDEPMDEPPTLVRRTWLERNLPTDHLWIFHHGESRRATQ